MKKLTYEGLKHDLDAKMLRASALAGQREQQQFVAQTFADIHKKYTEKLINHADYVKLMNRLSAYKQGAFNDYIDMLAGSAQLGMLDIAVQGTGIFSPEASRQRRQGVNDLTGTQPVQPEE